MFSRNSEEVVKEARNVIRDMELACDALKRGNTEEAERYVKGVQETTSRILRQLQEMKGHRPNDE